MPLFSVGLFLFTLNLQKNEKYCGTVMVKWR